MLIRCHSIKLRFPLWQFLNQPLLNSQKEAILNPFKFWQNYKIQLLNRCWEVDVPQILERYWQQELELAKISEFYFQDYGDSREI